MAFEFKANSLYRMPAHFGPSAGPRQGPNGEVFDWTDSPRRQSINLNFLSDASALEALLPPALELAGDPVVTIEITYFTELQWLAGRGYNTFGVRWPARFKGRQDDVVGSFLSILWENLPDPILSGRDELGFNKLYCEIPPPRIMRGKRHYSASWMDFRFFELEIDNMTESSVAELTQAQGKIRNDGLLHFKYGPRTGSRGEADINAITFTPATGSRNVIDKVWRCEGQHRFLQARWEDLPTMLQVVNGLHGLPIRERLGGWLIESHGGKDLGDQRTLV
jgi:hypothetical protein